MGRPKCRRCGMSLPKCRRNLVLDILVIIRRHFGKSIENSLMSRNPNQNVAKKFVDILDLRFWWFPTILEFRLMAGVQPLDSDLIPRLLEIVEFWIFLLTVLFSIKNEANTKILRCVGNCVGEFSTKNGLKLYIGQSILKKDVFQKFSFSSGRTSKTP